LSGVKVIKNNEKKTSILRTSETIWEQMEMNHFVRYKIGITRTVITLKRKTGFQKSIAINQICESNAQYLQP